TRCRRASRRAGAIGAPLVPEGSAAVASGLSARRSASSLPPPLIASLKSRIQNLARKHNGPLRSSDGSPARAHLEGSAIARHGACVAPMIRVYAVRLREE